MTIGERVLADNFAGLARLYPILFLSGLRRVLANEGGYTDRPDDAGGPTKYGISHRQYPNLDIAGLTIGAAAAIYYRDWWLRYGFVHMPGAVGIKLFDLAVNIGPSEAVICVQRALRACGSPVAEDGVLGPATTRAANLTRPKMLTAALRSEAAGHYRLLAARNPSGDRDFVKGWLNRAYQ
ncbi:MAG: glycoside hydrolase family 108 protein [Candidatus Binataceae bacterium]